MPTTTEKGYLIGIKQSGGSSGQSHISVTNGRTGDTLHIKTSSNEATTNLNNKKEFPNGFKNGDVIDITGTGLKTGNTAHTIDRTKGGGRITLSMTDASTTNAPEVRI